MATPERVKSTIKRLGLKGVNKPKRTPNHPTKSHVVMGKQGSTHKLVRFGQQGVSGEGNAPKTESGKSRRASFRARHKCQTATNKTTARYWACKTKW